MGVGKEKMHEDLAVEKNALDKIVSDNPFIAEFLVNTLSDLKKSGKSQQEIESGCNNLNVILRAPVDQAIKEVMNLLRMHAARKDVK